MQTTINRLNKDVVDLTQDADENLARRLREDMRELNESWSHIISSTKVHSQHIQVKIWTISHGLIIINQID
jgi:ABC-type sugar transport system ATPase subunit